MRGVALQDDPSEMFFPEESRSGADEAGPSRQLQSAPARNSLTPELVSEEHLMDSHPNGRSLQATRKLFPIFRPKSQWKVGHTCSSCSGTRT